jgi:hypothetical protein
MAGMDLREDLSLDLAELELRMRCIWAVMALTAAAYRQAADQSHNTLAAQPITPQLSATSTAGGKAPPVRQV